MLLKHLSKSDMAITSKKENMRDTVIQRNCQNMYGHYK